MTSLAVFIRQYKQQILDEWTHAARRLPNTHGLPFPLIQDHVPEILDKLAEAIERHDTSALPLEGLPNLHAALRARQGYDLREVIAEYRLLRRVIHRLYSREGDLPEAARPKMQALRIMHGALDAAVCDAVDQYALDRDRSRELFISMLGHDLRDPLNTIVFGSRFLWETCAEEISSRALKTATRISTSAGRMERMIRDLLDFAQGRLGGGLPVAPHPVDARPLIHDTVQEMAHANPDRDILCLARAWRATSTSSGTAIASLRRSPIW